MSGSNRTYTYNGRRPRSNVTNVIVAPGIISICDNAFECLNLLQTVTLPPTVTSIGKFAFYGCESLTDVTIPPNIQYIREGVFQNCYSLQTITLPPSVISIGKSAFAGCRNLTAIVIPPSVTSIGNCAFYGCERLTAIDIPPNVTFIGHKAFANCHSLTAIDIPRNVTFIEFNAFVGCASLTRVTISASIICIYEDAFEDCRSLTDIIFSPSIRCLTVLKLPQYNISSINANIGTFVEVINTHFPSDASGVYYASANSKVSQRLIDFVSNFIDDGANLVGRNGIGLFGTYRPKWYPCVVKKDNMDGTIKVQWDEDGMFTKRLPVRNFRLSMVECDHVFALYVNWTQWGEHNRRSPLFGAAEVNLCWDELKSILKSNNPDILEVDPKTNMEAFMLAAVGSDSELESVYTLLVNHPAAIIPYV